MMPRPAKKQNDFIESRLVAQPRKKAIALVKEVMVIEPPACIMPSLILFWTESFGFV